MTSCRHRPPCSTINPVACAQRTRIEQAIEDGVIDRASGARLCQLYGVPMTPPSRVDRGQARPVTPLFESEL